MRYHELVKLQNRVLLALVRLGSKGLQVVALAARANILGVSFGVELAQVPQNVLHGRRLLILPP